MSKEVSREQIVNDILRVQKELGDEYLSKKKYDKLGSYSSTTVQKVFGLWGNALKEILNVEPKIFIGHNGNVVPTRPCSICGKKTRYIKYCSHVCKLKGFKIKRKYKKSYSSLWDES